MSKTTAFTLCAFSKGSAPLIRIPLVAPTPGAREENSFFHLIGSRQKKKNLRVNRIYEQPGAYTIGGNRYFVPPPGTPKLTRGASNMKIYPLVQMKNLIWAPTSCNIKIWFKWKPTLNVPFSTLYYSRLILHKKGRGEYVFPLCGSNCPLSKILNTSLGLSTSL